MRTESNRNDFRSNGQHMNYYNMCILTQYKYFMNIYHIYRQCVICATTLIQGPVASIVSGHLYPLNNSIKNTQKTQNWLDSVLGHIKIRISPDPQCWAWSCLIIIIKSYNNKAAGAWEGSDKSFIAHTIQALSDCIREHFLFIRSAFWYIHTTYLLLTANYHTCIFSSRRTMKLIHCNLIWCKTA